MKKQLIFIGFLSLLSFGFSQEDIQEEFLESAGYGELEGVKEYLAKGADINGKSSVGYNAGEYAIWNIDDGDALINFLLDEGLDVNILNDDDENLLHVAAEYEGAIIMPRLVEMGCEINAKNSDGSTPIMLAAENSDFVAVKTLSDLGADISIENEDGKNIVNYFDIEDEEQWALLMDLNLSQKQKDQLLYKSANYLEDVEKVIALINLGANVNAKDDEGTPLIIKSVQFEPFDIFKELTSKGADVNATNEEGLTALWFYYDTDVLQLLIDLGANVNLNVDDYYSPLFYAINRADIESVKLLLAAGADPQLKIRDQNAHEFCKSLLKQENAPGVRYAKESDQKEHTKEWKSKIKEISILLK